MKFTPIGSLRNRYEVMEEVRTLLGFSKPEWRILLHALAKTDNGWLQFMFGKVCIDFKKFVDIDELHMRIVATKKNTKSKQSTQYVYDLTDFAGPSEARKNSVEE